MSVAMTAVEHRTASEVRAVDDVLDKTDCLESQLQISSPSPLTSSESFNDLLPQLQINELSPPAREFVSEVEHLEPRDVIDLFTLSPDVTNSLFSSTEQRVDRLLLVWLDL